MKPTLKTALVLPAAAVLLFAGSTCLADFDKGMQDWKAGKYVEAAAEFQALVDQSPEYDFGWFMLGNSFLQLKKYQDAESNLRKAVELNPDRFDYHLGLAKALMAQRKNSEAVKVLDDAEGLAADNKFKYALYSTRGNAFAYQRKWGEAVSDLEKAKAIKPSNTVLVQLGKAYFALGYHEKAAPVFEQALKDNPNDADTLRLLAESNIELGKGAKDEASKARHYRAALGAAEKANAMGETYETVNLVGRAALGAGQYDQAVAAFEKVLKLKPDYCFAMINLGKTYIAEEKWAKAEKPLKDAAACSPREAAVYESLGLVYQKYGKASQEAENRDAALKQYAQAKGYYQQALNLKSSKFVRDAIVSIDENIGVIEHNREQDRIAEENRRALEEEQQRVAEEERKRKEWEERQKRDN